MNDSPPPSSSAKALSPDLLIPRVTQWYQDNARDLPWRKPGTTPWGILVCEIMSQQTPVSRVVPIWQTWLDKWPTPSSFAHLAPAEVLIAWDRLGYPRRAVRLLECAQAITAEHNGKVPHDTEALLALPGIGAYTAAAVRAFAFGLHSVVLDTNIRRVLARLHGSALPAPHQTRTEADRAARFVPADDASAAAWNGAVMELGALVCTASSPQCGQCPMSDVCLWRASGYPADEFASTRKTQKFTGTQREARGKIMAVMRRQSSSHMKAPHSNNSDAHAPTNAKAPIQHNALAFSRTELQSLSGLSTERFTPALDSLLKDCLLTERSNLITLPQTTPRISENCTQ